MTWAFESKFSFNISELKMVQDILRLNQAEWDHVLETAMSVGELLYLTRKYQDSRHQGGDKSYCLFQVYCETLPQTVYCKHLVHCRPFKRDNLEAVVSTSGSQASTKDGYFVPKLFCLDLIKCWVNFLCT